MTDAQLYLATGLPSFVALVGILVNVGYFVVIHTRMQRLEDKFEGRMLRLEEKIETLTGKVMEVDNRVIRIEDKLGILPR